MKRKTLLIVGLFLALTLLVVPTVLAAGKNDLAILKRATAPFQRVEAARDAGYGLVPGLDNCFDNPGVGGMGYHYINTGLLDTTLELTKPEAMVYSSNPKGGLRLGAVEFIVPADAWDATGNSMPPEILGNHLHLNQALGVYVLHVWIYNKNPSGIYSDWNPKVSCP